MFDEQSDTNKEDPLEKDIEEHLPKWVSTLHTICEEIERKKRKPLLI